MLAARSFLTEAPWPDLLGWWMHCNAHSAPVNALTIGVSSYTMSKRVSLILKDSDEAALAPYLREGSVGFEALRQWAGQRGEGEIKSEAGALRALLQAGAEAVGERVLDAGYAELATEFNSESANAERRTARGRHARRSKG